MQPEGGGRHAAPGTAGDGRLPRLPVRFLYAGLRDVDVRLYHNDPHPTPTGIDDALAGNLCRCTGYTPIAAASQRMYELADPASDRFAHARAAIAEGLKALKDDKTSVSARATASSTLPPPLTPSPPFWPKTRKPASSPAAPMSLGSKFQRVLDVVIYTGRIQGFRDITDTGGQLEIGAGAPTPTSRPPRCSTPTSAIRRIGAVQVRNVGTIGSNIANGSPIGDPPPP